MSITEQPEIREIRSLRQKVIKKINRDIKYIAEGRGFKLIERYDHLIPLIEDIQRLPQHIINNDILPMPSNPAKFKLNYHNWVFSLGIYCEYYTNMINNKYLFDVLPFLRMTERFIPIKSKNSLSHNCSYVKIRWDERWGDDDLYETEYDDYKRFMRKCRTDERKEQTEIIKNFSLLPFC
jgi:hypothetical protein